MKIFISWAGERSKKTAEVFVAWLPSVIRESEPWISVDSSKGERFTPEITHELAKSKIGLICLTPENIDDKWIKFEANCLSKFQHLKVCTFLLDVKPSDIRPPLSRFPYTIFTKDDVHRLVRTINTQLAPVPDGKPIHPQTLGIIFSHYWPKFEKQMEEIIQSKNKKIFSEIDQRIDELQGTLRGTRRHTTKVPEIQEAVPFNILAVTERRYFSLVNEIGVSPNEAIKTIMKELDRKYGLQIETRNMIFGHLMDFVRIKRSF